MDSQWLSRPQANPDAELRLVCVPYAGGAASVYRPWCRAVPNTVEVCAVELPGRGSRMQEAAFTSLTPLVRELTVAVEPILDRPFALFGHSMGGLIAFELARSLRRRGWPMPRHLFVSAVAAPGTPPRRMLLHQATDPEIVSRLRALNGTPRELLDNNDLMALMVPVIRADFSVLETYAYQPEPPLETPITVFGGAFDPIVKPPTLTGWRDHSSAGVRFRFFPGDHFFLRTAVDEIVSTVTEDLGLTRAATTPHPGSRDFGPAAVFRKTSAAT